jgi:glycosyltransferase involved in cell wall biosynthesis
MTTRSSDPPLAERRKSRHPTPRIAVILPCYNEELTVGPTIEGFQANLPQAEIWVCDNRSTDRTSEIALSKNARVIKEPTAGKGNAVRRLFAVVDVDVYVLADGDSTYDASAAPELIRVLLAEHHDMIIARRVPSTAGAFRKWHRFGNKLFSTVGGILFGFRVEDVLSGYRVFSRRFVKTFPATSEGFEIESELTVHAIDQRLPTCEIDTQYLARPKGSHSKLSTFRDGLRILFALLRLFRDVKPFQFFTAIAAALLLAAMLLAIPVFHSYFTRGVIPKIPTAILVTGMAVSSFVIFVSGVILDAIRLSRHNQFRAAYLAQDTSYFRVKQHDPLAGAPIAPEYEQNRGHRSHPA